jgi:hypothetical protein
MDPGFVSNVCGCILRMVQEELPRCVADVVLFRALFVVTNETRRPSARRPLCGNA